MKKTTFFLHSALCLLTCGGAFAADPNPPRLFFSDAKISFVFPQNWELQQSFPYGPLFTKTTNEGGQAIISCVISQSLYTDRMVADVSSDTLKNMAKGDLQSHQRGLRVIGEKEQSVAGHNAYDITWQNGTDDPPVIHESTYLFIDNRVYAFGMLAPPQSFRWLAPDFQAWVQSLQILSRKNAGELPAPAHGGMWVHQTGGLKIMVPVNWLIGVADDQTVAATFVRGNQHADFTVTLDISPAAGKDLSRAEKRQARKAILKKGLRIIKESDSVFHGYPAFEVTYEGSTGDRVIRGQDIWIVSPKARWLINLEGDVPLFNALGEDFDRMLTIMQFL